MKVMPKEPTQYMCGKARKASKVKVDRSSTVMDIYRAFYDSAPCPWTKINGPKTLPDSEDPVLVVSDDYLKPITAWYADWGGWFGESEDLGKVTHWMALPKKPKDK